VRLHLPPSRERRDDIAELARHFLAVHAARLGIAVTGISAAAMRVLLDAPWPGNVRELENAIERALVLCDQPQLDAGHLSSSVRDGAPRASANGTADHDADLSVKRRTVALERDLIRRALERTGGNRTRAAQILELSHRALLYKIRDYELE
jgi:two-component system response regulator AtoC